MRGSAKGKDSVKSATYHERNKSNIFNPSSPKKEVKTRASVNASPERVVAKGPKLSNINMHSPTKQEKFHVRTSSAPKISEANYSKILNLKDQINHIEIKRDVYEEHNINRDYAHLKKEYMSLFGSKDRHFVVDDSHNSKYVKQAALRSNILNDPSISNKKLIMVNIPKPQESLMKNSKQKQFFSDYKNDKNVTFASTTFHKKKSDLILENEWSHHQHPQTTCINPTDIHAAGLLSSKQKKIHSLYRSEIFGKDEPSLIGESRFARPVTEGNVTPAPKKAIEQTSLQLKSFDNKANTTEGDDSTKQFFKYKVKTKVFNTESDRYEIKNLEKTNYNLEDIKRKFIKNGLHIYDFGTNTRGSISFKIRKLDDNVAMKDRFTQIANDINRDGLTVQTYHQDFMKKCEISEATKHENRKRSQEFKENTEKPKKSMKEQRVSKFIVDHQYKSSKNSQIMGRKK